MFSLRGLFYVTFFCACMIALWQFGPVGRKESVAIGASVAAIGNLAAFWTILRWIREVEHVRKEGSRAAVALADTTAFVMFACQLVVACRVFLLS